MSTERQYRGYHHPTTREEMGLRPGEVQTKIFHKQKFQKPKPENFMSQEIETLPLDGQPQIIDDLVYDAVDVNIKIQPLTSITAKTVPKVALRNPRLVDKTAQLDVTKIDWSMVTDQRGKKSYTIPQLKQIVADKGKGALSSTAKKSDYVDYILRHQKEWTK